MALYSILGDGGGQLEEPEHPKLAVAGLKSHRAALVQAAAAPCAAGFTLGIGFVSLPFRALACY